MFVIKPCLHLQHSSSHIGPPLLIWSSPGPGDLPPSCSIGPELPSCHIFWWDKHTCMQPGTWLANSTTYLGPALLARLVYCHRPSFHIPLASTTGGSASPFPREASEFRRCPLETPIQFLNISFSEDAAYRYRGGVLFLAISAAAAELPTSVQPHAAVRDVRLCKSARLAPALCNEAEYP